MKIKKFLNYFEDNLIIEEINKEGYQVLDLVSKNKNYIQKTLIKNNNNFLAKIFNKRKLFNNLIIKNEFYNEIKIATLFKNNISNKLWRLKEYFYTKNYCFIIYYFNDIQLLKILWKRENKNKIFKINYILILIKDLLTSIEELQKKKIIHCSITIENIYFNENRFILGGYNLCRYKNESKLSSLNYLFFSKNNELKFNLLSPELILNKFLNFKTQIFNLLLLIYTIVIKENLIEFKKFTDLKSFYSSNENLNIIKLEFYIKNFNLPTKETINLLSLFQKALIKKIENRISFFDFKINFFNIIKKLDFYDHEYIYRNKIFIENFKFYHMNYQVLSKNNKYISQNKIKKYKKTFNDISTGNISANRRLNRSENFKRIIIKTNNSFFKKKFN